MSFSPSFPNRGWLGGVLKAKWSRHLSKLAAKRNAQDAAFDKPPARKTITLPARGAAATSVSAK